MPRSADSPEDDHLNQRPRHVIAAERRRSDLTATARLGRWGWSPQRHALALEEYEQDRATGCFDDRSFIDDEVA